MVTTGQRALQQVAWALLLMLWVITAYNAQSGFSSSGPMNLHFAPALLVLFSVPVSLLAPWVARTAGVRLHRTAAWVALAITCWWQFWLPATLLDIGYSHRYGIPTPYIWPAPHGTPALALSMALWLAAPLADWKGWHPWACWALGAAGTAAVVVTLDGLRYIDVPWPVALGCLAACITLMAMRLRCPAERRTTRWLLLWCSGMMVLPLFWFATAWVSGWMPPSMNRWFADWLYS